MIRAALLTVLLRGGAAAIDAPGLLDELDTLKPLTYEGHIEDVAELEESVVKWPRLAEDKLEQIKRRHAWLGNGDSSHPQIQRLFALRDTLTYPTRTEDVAAALKRHLGYFGKHKNHMRDNLTDKSFDRTLDELRAKEDLFSARAHPILKALDASKPFTYEGHVEDVAELEESVVKWPRLAEDKLEQIKRRHAWLGNGDSSHPQIQRLFALRDTLTYPTRTEDVAAALKRHLGYFGKYKNHMRDNLTDKSFDRTLDEMRTKEALHVKKGKKGEL
jgi:hypothetical protein